MYPCKVDSREINHTINCMYYRRLFGVKSKKYRVTCSLKYEGLHLLIFATNHCLLINSFVFFSGFISIIHVYLICFLINYLRYNTVTRCEYTGLFYSNHRIATAKIVRYIGNISE